jgi:6-phosphogluconolactonase
MGKDHLHIIITPRARQVRRSTTTVHRYGGSRYATRMNKFSSLTYPLLGAWLTLGCAASTNTAQDPSAEAVAPEPTTNAPAEAPVDEPAPAEPVAEEASVPLARLYVGSGDWGTDTGAITVYAYNPNTGSLAKQSRVEAGGLLSFLATDSQRRVLYAADEGHAKLRSFSIDTESGSLAPVATTDMIAGPVYVNVPSNDRFILAAEFNSGRTEVFPLDGAGGFGKRTANADSGKESHGVFLSPNEQFAFVSSRASNQLRSFKFDNEKGTLTANATTSLPKGVGCRHLDFHPNGKFLYLINEFANTIVAFSYNETTAKLTEIQTISTNPDTEGTSSAADIHVHPSGKFLYATNRPAEANGSIVVYNVGEDGKLTFVQKESTEGRVPRNFDLLSDATRLVVGNQESKSIISFVIDPEAGTLTKQAVTEVDVKPFFVNDLL